MNQTANGVTPFCLGCGDWIFEKPEIDDSPFYYCVSCTPKKRVVKVKRKYTSTSLSADKGI
jgi:hypothetical protein